jgi:hypothetical protein
LSSIITAKASAVLILVIAVSLVQVTVSLMPKNANLANINAEGGVIPAPEYGAKTYPGPPTSAAFSAVSPANQTVTLATTQTLTMPSTVATTVVVTNSTTLLAQSIAGPDYTPVGIAIVAAVAIIVLALMFLRRRR